MAAIEDITSFSLGKLMDHGDGLTKSFNRKQVDNRTDNGVSAPALTDILSTPKEYTFYIDVPGLSKSDVQVQLEGENVLVIRGKGKRKREDEAESCTYLKLERSALQKTMRKFRLPQDADPASISAKCENGVLTVTVAKVPPAEPKTVEVTIT